MAQPGPSGVLAHEDRALALLECHFSAWWSRARLKKRGRISESRRA